MSAADDEIGLPRVRGLDHELAGRRAHRLDELRFNRHLVLRRERFAVCEDRGSGLAHGVGNRIIRNTVELGHCGQKLVDDMNDTKLRACVLARELASFAQTRLRRVAAIRRHQNSFVHGRPRVCFE